MSFVNQPYPETEVKRKQACHLRTLGYSYEKIGYAMGISATYATTLVKQAMQKVAKEDSLALLNIELSRLDQTQELVSKSLARMLTRLQHLEEEGDWTTLPASAKEIQQVVGANLSVMERRAKLLGLEAPKRTEITGANGGAIENKWVVEITDSVGKQAVPALTVDKPAHEEAAVIEYEERVVQAETHIKKPWED